jgi:DNA-binding GntR family transcriptional regulator
MMELCEATKVASAYVRIKQLVVECRFYPGEHLQVGEISDWLRLSVTPVREALMRLSVERFIDCFPNRGYFAKKFDICEQQILHDAADVILFHSVNYDLLTPLSAGEHYAEGAASTVEHLYEVIASRTGNLELAHFIRNYNERTHFIRKIYVADREDAIYADTRGIIEALEGLRTAEAAAILARHRGHFSSALPELLKQALAQTLVASASPTELPLNHRST